MQRLTSLARKNLKGRVCILRAGLDVKTLDEELRIRTSAQTAKWLVRRGATVVIIAHRGRPTRRDPRLSLKPLVPLLSRFIRRKVTFISRLDIPHLKQEIRAAKPRSVFLLENLRFHMQETDNDAVFGRKLASLGDFYVSEAFSVSHRKHASLVRIPRLLPSYAGPHLAEEVEHLKTLTGRVAKPFVVILGGAKISDKIGIIDNFLNKADYFLIGGGAANTFLKARGEDIGNSLYEKNMVRLAKQLLLSAKIILPTDFVANRKRLLDVGPLTIRHFSEYIRSAKTIVWNGPMGLYEDKRFRAGSVGIARAIANAKAFSVVGGGETTDLILDIKLEKKMSFVSNGGGAMLAYLAGEKLPGLEALQKNRKRLL
jgi:3-phosphoglycerate kinase